MDDLEKIVRVYRETLKGTNYKLLQSTKKKLKENDSVMRGISEDMTDTIISAMAVAVQEINLPTKDHLEEHRKIVDDMTAKIKGLDNKIKNRKKKLVQLKKMTEQATSSSTAPPNPMSFIDLSGDVGSSVSALGHMVASLLASLPSEQTVSCQALSFVVGRFHKVKLHDGLLHESCVVPRRPTHWRENKRRSARRRSARAGTTSEHND
eukprot:GHVS01014594.1.p1 GENE.GHVS01014594.1~~GHVS01014594.1.p1  ORF type:complete len:208 (-),score=21.93 GHVS01014594.1:17-640(-)